MISTAIMSDEENTKVLLDDYQKAALTGAAKDVIDKYGSAEKQHLVAYSGKDNELGKDLKRGLKKTASSKINSNPKYKDSNIKSQAGYAAEDKYVARQNAEKIINGDNKRYSRTDDVGKVNDEIFDHVLLDKNGAVIPGTGEQMKFIGSDPKSCLNKLKSKKFQKYLDNDATITVPSDYYDGIIQEANKQISRLKKQIESAQKSGNVELVKSKQEELAKVQKIKNSVKNSGITNKEAITARRHPKLSTAADVTKLSHQAGLKQAKYGFVISGGISLIRNTVSVTKGEKTPKEAAIALFKDTGTGSVASYATAFTGSAIKAGMQNASKISVRNISKTNAPAAIVNSTIDVAKSLKKFFSGEITGAECLVEIGEKGTGNLSAAMFTVVGQAAIPIPVVGAMVGSMIGYALSSCFYKELTTSLTEAQLARKERVRVQKKCAEARKMIEEYRKEMNDQIDKHFAKQSEVFKKSFRLMDRALKSDNIDDFIKGANMITEYYGGNAPFGNLDEFESFMGNKSGSLDL